MKRRAGCSSASETRVMQTSTRIAEFRKTLPAAESPVRFTVYGKGVTAVTANKGVHCFLPDFSAVGYPPLCAAVRGAETFVLPVLYLHHGIPALLAAAYLADRISYRGGALAAKSIPDTEHLHGAGGQTKFDTDRIVTVSFSAKFGNAFLLIIGHNVFTCPFYHNW